MGRAARIVKFMSDFGDVNVASASESIPKGAFVRWTMHMRLLSVALLKATVGMYRRSGSALPRAREQGIRPDLGLNVPVLD